MLLSKSIAFSENELEETAAAASSTYVSVSPGLGFIERLKAGDADAFDTLVTRYSGEIYSVIYRLTGDPDESADLTQETFLRALRAIEKFRGDSDLKTWLYRIAVNESRNRFRWWKRRRRDKTVSLDAAPGNSEVSYSETVAATSASPEDEALRREREKLIQDALCSLPAVYREPIVLFDIEGLTYNEICETLGLNQGTLKSRLARGREELRRRLADF
jgi:RNA polymerase sigma-70 factor (ECF subfamily)